MRAKQSRAQSKYISWKQLSPIFADVVVSPWNLLVGGLLIHSLTLLNAVICILIGYAVLAVVFVLYGGLGFNRRVQSSVILSEIFQGKFSSVFIPVLLAAGQLGWAAINISLGGYSLATLTHVPASIGLIVYAAVLAVMAGLNLYRLAVVKYAITFSAVGLVVFVLAAKVSPGSMSQLIAYTPPPTLIHCFGGVAWS